MTSRDGARGVRDPGDVGLLAPVSAGSPAEAATGDSAVLRAMLAAEAALTRAQATLGAAPERAASAVAKAACPEAFDARALALRAGSGGNPVIPLVADLRRAVSELSPGDEEFVHRGATSQDILDTALMLVAARTLDLIATDLAATAGSLAVLADRHSATPMAARTLTQHAVATTFGLKAAGWRSLVVDAHERVVRVRSTLPAQLGGAAGTLAAFELAGMDGPALVEAFAAELGLAAPGCRGTSCARRWLIWVERWRSARGRWGRWPRMCWCCPARRWGKWRRVWAGSPPRCRTRAIRCAPS